MEYQVIGKNVQRWDAIAKVKGTAEFTADAPPKNMLHGKIVRSTITHGIVKNYDITEALEVPGVIKILTPEDLPQTKYSTAGHPYALEPGKGDIEDRSILTRRVRQYGDEIAAVIAETELAAEKACEKIKVEYEPYPFYLTPEESLAADAVEIHEGSKNIIADTTATVGETEKSFEEADFILEDEYSTQIVQHCHLESQIAYAYQDVDQRWVCVSSTQIPHICRRILGQALDMPWGRFRVVKPFIGGGFGNKQDVSIEPLVVAMSMAVHGKPVQIHLTREESMAYTRVRHAISYKMKMGLKKDGSITALDVSCISNNGAYASHGHAIAAKGSGFLVGLYKIPNLKYRARTVYTNTASAGAMRGYGIPQVMFAMESFMDKAARKLKTDPVQFRLQNIVEEGLYNPLNHIYQFTNGLKDCILQGSKQFGWEEKKNNKQAEDHIKTGVGVAAFSYGSGVYPKGLEVAGCRIVLNQDGSVKLMLGATEIGQGSDTVFSQMVAETLGIACDKVYVDAKTDTDIAPFDTGAYASRQSYVTGMAVRKAAEELKQKILQAAETFEDVKANYLDILDGIIVYKHNGQPVITLQDLALKSFYDIQNGALITADASVNCHENSYSMGVTFAEVAVDTKTGKVHLVNLLNAHDSGKILNPLLASGQVEGGMMMGIGFGLSEELMYNPKTGEPYNNNLLDYKFPTMMDVCDLQTLFVEQEDPIGPYGNKSLGEPPTCSPAPAIRNAVLDALGIEINHLPLSPQKVFEALQKGSGR